MADPDVALMQQLHDDHGEALWRFCRRLVPTDRGRAEDVVQETLLRAWRDRTILESPSPAVRAWLFTVARNIVIDQWRSRRAHPETPLAELPDDGVDDESDHVLLSWVVSEALTQLSPEHRAVLLECYYRGRPVAEAARRLGVPEGTVKSRTHYALRALKLALEEMGGPMTCEFALDDGAYVLGALSPTERLAFKQHLAGCAECTRSVGELAGLPGLLGRVDQAVLERPDVEAPPPTLLPALFREVRRTRRRRTLTTVGLAAAAAVAVVVPVGVMQLGDEPRVPPTPQASADPTPVAQPMEPIGDVPVQATLSLEEVTWGTRLGLTCTYDPDSVEGDLPDQTDYTLFVRTRTGDVEQVGSWRSVGGREMEILAATAVTASDLASVEVRTPDGRVVLRLTT